MGGYNTFCEILSFDKPALIVPRTAPRLEQWIRARRFAELGLVDMLGPEQFSPRGIGAWLASDRKPVAQAYEKIDFGGLDRIPALFNELLDGSTLPRTRPAVAPGIALSLRAGRVSHVTG
jgi:predicted glycosyltransferase